MPPSSDHAACAATLRGGSRSFRAASLLLPSRVRIPAVALYAFCRLADDAVDEGGGPTAVARLRERLARVYDGHPAAHPADRAMADVVARFGIPRAIPEALLEGFAWDAEGRRYEDLSALMAYAARVAGTVGAMMALLMDAREQTARACDLGVAMQLTNIARDVGEDARAGRLYLPLAWLREAGIDPDGFLAAPVHDAALAGVVARLLAVADSLYRRAERGIAALPLDCRAGIAAARLLYAEIGHELARCGHDSVSQRAVVGLSRKLSLLPRAAAALAWPTGPALPPLAETRFLVQAVHGAPRRRTRQEPRAIWVLELFAQLDQRLAP